MSPPHPVHGPTWEIKSRATSCHATEKPFAEGEVIYSRLMQQVDGLHREDYSREAWNDALRDQSWFHWKTRFRGPAPKKEPPFREDNAEEFLRGLLERKDPAVINTIYILAVMLERKRILIERGVQPDAEGQKIRIYEHRDSGETFFVRDPELSLEQIGDVQREVALELGWIKPPQAEETPESEDETEE